MVETLLTVLPPPSPPQRAPANSPSGLSVIGVVTASLRLPLAPRCLGLSVKWLALGLSGSRSMPYVCLPPPLQTRQYFRTLFQTYFFNCDLSLCHLQCPEENCAFNRLAEKFKHFSGDFFNDTVTFLSFSTCLSSRDPYCVWLKSGSCATMTPGLKYVLPWIRATSSLKLLAIWPLWQEEILVNCVCVNVCHFLHTFNACLVVYCILVYFEL